MSIRPAAKRVVVCAFAVKVEKNKKKRNTSHRICRSWASLSAECVSVSAVVAVSFIYPSMYSAWAEAKML